MTSSRMRSIFNWVRRGVREDNAYLLPLRFFIGIGWFRAGLEKLQDPNWPDGVALSTFLHQKLEGGAIVFPSYREVVESVFLPNVQLLALIVIGGQLLAGIAIMSGTFTNAALLGGLFMNINFILAGQVNPSAFYVIIQSVLFVSNVGAVLGVDEFLSRRIRYTLLVAHPHWERDYLPIEKRSLLLLSLLSGLFAIVAAVHVEDWGPKSVEDPAMILLVLSTLGGLSTLIVYFRFGDRTVAGPTPF